jgi:hypothetical protein
MDLITPKSSLSSPEIQYKNIAKNISNNSLDKARSIGLIAEGGDIN